MYSKYFNEDATFGDFDSFDTFYKRRRAGSSNPYSNMGKDSSGTLKIISTPEYKHPERLRPKFRRFELPEITIKQIVNTLAYATNQKDSTRTVIHVEGEGHCEIPRKFLNRIKSKEIILIKDYEENEERYYMGSRQIKRQFWSYERLLWECLKESQYVDFEEISV